MPEDKTPDEVARSTEKAKDYFSKVQGFQPPASEKPAASEPAPEDTPAAPKKPEAPLSEAEKAWKGIMGK